MTNIAINGFGRIGRLFFRAAMQNDEFKRRFNVVAVNDLMNTKTLSHLLKYDSNFGKYPGKVTVDEDTMIKEYLNAMDWDLETAKPSQKKLYELGLEDVSQELYT